MTHKATSSLAAALLMVGLPGLAAAQDRGSEADVAGADGTAIPLPDVIVDTRRGSAGIPPEIELDEDAIDAFGAYDIGEAIARISQSLGFEAPPVILVNGRRVVNPGVFLGFPPDALVRVEALPDGAAATLGADPGRRVLNIVLQPTYRSRDVKAVLAQPTAGGRTSLAFDARQGEIQGNDTSQFGIDFGRETALRADERPDYLIERPERVGATLRPAVESGGASLAINRVLGDWSGSASASIQYRRDRSASFVSGQIVDGRREATTLVLAGGLAGEVSGWAVRLAMDGQFARTDQTGLSEGRYRNASGSLALNANRALFELPAGSVQTTVSGRYARYRSNQERDGSRLERSVDSLDLGGSATIPLTTTRPLSMTLGGGVRRNGDAEGSALNGGLNWLPARGVRLGAQWSRSTEAPNDQQRLAAPFVGEPRVVFDFLTGQGVEVLPVFGGNPDLQPQTIEQVSLTGAFGPFTSLGLLGNMTLRTVSTDNAIGVLPALTPEVEAVFPDRFERDGSGRLIRIDLRPINIRQTRMTSLTSGLNFNLPLGDMASGPARIGLTHTWQITNLVTIRDGIPRTDRLAGDAGGAPRHQLGAQADLRRGRWGMNLAARWREGSRIRRQSGRDGPDDLIMDDLSNVDVRISYQLGLRPAYDTGAERARRYDGLRLELSVDNLFDARPRARLANGRNAPGYGRDSQDPLGRMVRLALTGRF